jgi:DNA-binding transcriptional regulator LsrR (DeoR family)
LSEEQRKQVAKYNDGWMGLRHHHILACAKKAKPGVPGVVVISHDARRAEVIQAAICAGLVNHVVMDGKLSEALKALPAPNKVED